MQNLEEFNHHKFNTYPENLHPTIGQFNVFQIETRMRKNEEFPIHGFRIIIRKVTKF